MSRQIMTRARLVRTLLDFMHKEGIEWEFGWEDEGFLTVTFFFEEDDDDYLGVTHDN